MEVGVLAGVAASKSVQTICSHVSNPSVHRISSTGGARVSFVHRYITFTSYRQHVAKVGVGKSVRHTSSVYTRSRGWHSHEVYCAEGSLRNLFSRVTGLAYKEFNRRMVFVSLLFTGHPSVRHPARSNSKQTAEAQFPA